MAYTTINKSSEHFNTKLYTGNGSTNAITGVGFQPDFVWLKSRVNTSTDHKLFDAVRQSPNFISSNLTSAEAATSYFSGFQSDGFTVTGNNGQYNSNTDTFVSWNWKAGGGAGSSNTDGSINTTSTSVNTTAGFSISKFTGTGANATVGHGLGVAPSMIIVKNLSISSQWWVYHASLGATKALNLNATDAEQTVSVIWNNTAPTSSVFSVGTGNEVNGSGNSMIAYCFAPKTGYSKFGSYTGNNNADGPFIYTGFKPAFVILKRSNSGTQSWYIYDNKRDGYNGSTDGYMLRPLWANSSNNEAGVGNYKFDILSNGFKLRETGNQTNGDGHTYVYMAFGQSIVGSNNIPCVAF